MAPRGPQQGEGGVAFRYLVVEGPPAVGKTALARRLAESFGARLLRGGAADNPFLEAFYRDRRKYAFQTQLFFLTSRYQQQQELAQPELFSRVTVADYLFARDRIFAYLTLDDTELAMYEKIYRMVEPAVPRPDLVVYLQAGADVLHERIRRRGRPGERHLEPEYLEQVVQAFNSFFFHYSDSPLLVVDVGEVDLAASPDDYADLLREIRRAGPGTQYFVPRRRG
ncbi:MAG TPA: deoxynucleoside kinase [Thermodesulfobacteriota bacterium]|nr:deoxynucleoside kinase [Thermodesulfobacteriota bacterium]